MERGFKNLLAGVALAGQLSACDNIVEGNANGIDAIVRYGNDLFNAGEIDEIVKKFRDEFPSSAIQPIPKKDFAQENRDNMPELDLDNIQILLRDAFGEILSGTGLADVTFDLLKLIKPEYAADENGKTHIVLNFIDNDKIALGEIFSNGKVAFNHQKNIPQTGVDRFYTLHSLTEPDTEYLINIYCPTQFGRINIEIKKTVNGIKIDEAGGDISYRPLDWKVLQLDFGVAKNNVIRLVKRRNLSPNTHEYSYLSTDGMRVKSTFNRDGEGALKTWKGSYKNIDQDGVEGDFYDIASLKVFLKDVQSSSLLMNLFDDLKQNRESERALLNCTGIDSEESLAELIKLMPKHVYSHLSLFGACTKFDKEVGDNFAIDRAIKKPSMSLSTQTVTPFDVVQYHRHIMRTMSGGEQPVLWIYNKYESAEQDPLNPQAAMRGVEVCVKVEDHPATLLGDGMHEKAGEGKVQCTNYIGGLNTMYVSDLHYNATSEPRIKSLYYNYFW